MLEISEEKRALLVKVARLYYEHDLTQAEIAERLNISRPQISRLLTESRQLGIVKISIEPQPNKHASLRQDLLHHFDLKSVQLLPSGQMGYPQLTERLGILAARHLETELRDDTIIGISWSTGVYQVVNALRAARRKKVTVIQLTGAVGSINPLLDGPDLTRWLAKNLGGQYRYLPAPLLVESPGTRDALLREPSIRAVMTLMTHMHMALVGIGSLVPPLSNLLNAQFITEAELREIIRQGGVGDICAHHYNLHGNILPLDLHQRLVTVTLDVLRNTPYVIAVGGGLDKAAAILGALRLGIIDCLVTDEIAARAVLRIAQVKRRKP